MMEGEVVLVTGAGGLIGHALRRRLEERGTRVVPIDRMARTADGIDLVEADVGDIHRLHALITGHGVTSIAHCGAFSGPMVSRDNPYAIVAVNVVGTANLLEAARIHGLRRFVFCSSVSAYGSTPPGPVPEDVPMAPSSVYGASKVASEQLVNAYALQHGVDGVSLRFSWVYGPRRRTDCFIRTMIEDARASRPTVKPFGQDFHRQYIYVEDAVSGIVLALDATSLPRRSYNVTGGTRLTLAEVAAVAKRVLPQAEVRLAPGPDPLDDKQEAFDIGAARADLGYAPRYGLEEGIRAYARWIEAGEPVAG
jgi:nucleoside-diphosphate-sugar epimerase